MLFHAVSCNIEIRILIRPKQMLGCSIVMTIKDKTSTHDKKKSFMFLILAPDNDSLLCILFTYYRLMSNEILQCTNIMYLFHYSHGYSVKLEYNIICLYQRE